MAGRDEFFGKLPSVGSGRVPPVLVFVGVGITLLLIWVIFPYDWLVALEYQMIFAIIITSLVVVTGYAGQISLAQMALAGIGALIAAWLYSSYHVPFELALVAGVIAVVPVGVVIALAGVRTRGVALAIVTLGLAFSLEAIIFTNEQFTGGVNGFDTDNPHFFGIAVGGSSTRPATPRSPWARSSSSGWPLPTCAAAAPDDGSSPCAPTSGRRPPWAFR